ncbi:outer membrane protein OmpA-like peptidoglycan-associated protein [Flavobacterium sp. PL11]|jgi:outer membrane protein OmpA-like peptidoglycan-associated protein|uniref:OmpA family protein n=1 Tax=Flavobacterium sp. PL11 TaxID=3071717 RepID=UPI002E081993|nr:outer membrane protein OmpA-like peptidoglycan-associated protein [Flavobacterium sp. PL11]
MKSAIRVITLLLWSYLAAQEKPVETVYFDFDKSKLNKDQIQNIIRFVQNSDTSTVESIEIYGYCDDRGANDYNYKLSQRRVQTVQNVLIENGINKNKIIIFEGRGKILLKENEIETIKEIRSKNRRVDLLIVLKNNFGKGIYTSFQNNHKVGDRVFLQNILFQLGSSKLTFQSQRELNNIVLLLQKQKTLEFEIQGHVCCTSKLYADAIDKESNEHNLSINRAKTVYHYLRNKGISRLRMSYIGKGNNFPLGKGDKLDRRVEFYISKI